MTSSRYDTPKARARMRKTGADLSGGYVWPRAGLSLLTLGLKWLALTFRLDDQLDEDAVGGRSTLSQCIEELCGVLHGHPAPPSPVADALHELWAETREDTPPSWRHAFVADFEAFLRAYALEAELKEAGQNPTLEEYLAWRIYAIGMPWLWVLDELGLPLFLPDSVRTCRPMGMLRRAGSLHIALVNDVFSVERESTVGYPYNAVLLIMQARECPMQTAVDHIAELVTEQAETVKRLLANDIPAELHEQQIPANVRTVVLQHCENIAMNLRGQLAWHTAVDRYTTGDLQGQWAGSYPDDLLRQTD
ncbi:terpene synthase family protein [Streptomyces justiciae]|uniref:terpene synthase family protein n=1 Tax=Streptomyces justiciae TaxID=2780140 RepID=UPI0021196389|nr:terpene synthase family protein [Streptomyces justiciae]MCW8379775.1 terpene synthase family protein [Streptomyces justiciae]